MVAAAAVERPERCLSAVCEMVDDVEGGGV